MKLDKHIAYRFLTDEEMAMEITMTMFPYLNNITKEEWLNRGEDKQLTSAASTYYTVSNKNHTKVYYVAHTVMDKLDMLKVKKDTTYPAKIQESIIGRANLKIETSTEPITTFNWDVFSRTPQIMKDGETRKYTYIFPDNSLLRLVANNGYIAFFYLRVVDTDPNDNRVGNVSWVAFWVNIKEHSICTHWRHKDVQQIEELIYKLLCFLYLSENDELVIQPGQKHGTRKSGKFINSLFMPVTVVNSRWNVTSIRNEGFDVSGHFRLQPTKDGHKMIFINPFRKHGYIRRAKNITQ